MAQYASSGISHHNISATGRLTIPMGSNLSDSITRTLTPSMGALAYDAPANLVYYGDVDTWNLFGGGGIGSTGMTGRNGVTGLSVTGSTGLGSTGSTGLGLTGSTGLGSTGSTGLGSTGSTGLGSTGSTGLGSTGSTGLGSTGSTGLGSTGSTGLGSTGSTGLGSTGSTGSGSTGSTGSSSTGSTGLGSTGRTGLGSTGNTGAQGNPVVVDGLNVGPTGSGTGEVFRDTTSTPGSTVLNFRTLIGTNHILTDTDNPNVNEVSIATNATPNNVPNTIVSRDSGGSFISQNITADGNFILSTEPSTAIAGNVMKGAARFIHNFGTNSTFVGINAGNFGLTGAGNSGFGNSALTSLTSSPQNTAIGSGSMQNLTGGNGRNVGVGFNALGTSTSAEDNVGVGNNSLFANTTGSRSTAVGSGALQANNTNSDNTGLGYRALANNTDMKMTAVGSGALENYVLIFGGGGEGPSDGASVAIGYYALNSNVAGFANTAIGYEALLSDVTTDTGGNNTGVGYRAIANNILGENNTGVGSGVLSNLGGGVGNTAIGNGALNGLLAGSNNIGIGNLVGEFLTSGDSNIYIGSSNDGGDESGTIRIGYNNAGDPLQTACYIQGISGQTSTGGVAVFINGDGKLGTIVSSERFKHNIEDMGDTNILQVKPVSFIYNEDKTNTKEYGAIAEQVEKVFPELVVYDKEGRPNTIKYHLFAPLLLNEVQKQQTTIETMNNMIISLQAELQKVNQNK